MARCPNKVAQFVARGYAYREILLPCGSTGQHGQRLQCATCEAAAERQNPQGWRDSPGDTCRHGTYVGDAYGPDYICGQCEAGDD